MHLLTGIIFGLGLSELALIIVAVLLFMGPKRIQTIKPFLKVLYKNYLAYMREVTAMQGEMDQIKKTIMEPLEEVEKEAEDELRKIEKDATKDMEGADEIKQGLRAIIDERKKEMEQLKKEAEVEGTSKADGKMNAAAVSRGANIGFLGKQAPGAQLQQQSSARMPQSAATQMQPGRQMAPFMQGQRPGMGQMQKMQQGAQAPASTPSTKGIPDFLSMRGQPASFQMQRGAAGIQLNQIPIGNRVPQAQTDAGRTKVDISQAPVTQKEKLPEAEASAKAEPVAPLETKAKIEKPEEVELSDTSTPLKAEGAVIIAKKSKPENIQEQQMGKEPVADKQDDKNVKFLSANVIENRSSKLHYNKKEEKSSAKGDRVKKPKDRKSKRRR